MENKIKLKSVFTEVLLGYSVIHGFSQMFDMVYIKHFTALEMAHFNNTRNYYYESALAKSIPNRDQKIKYLYDEKLWSQEREQQILDSKYFLDGLRITKTKLHLPSQIEQINKQIKEEETKLSKLESEKNSLIEYTAETYATRKINELFIQKTLYKDNQFTTLLFDEKAFNEFDDEKELSTIIDTYNQKMGDFCSSNLKKVGFLDEFFSLFLISNDNPYYLYGKPVIHLSNFQIEIFQHAKNFSNILSNSKSPPPADVLSDPDKLEEWFSFNKNADELLNKDNNAAATSLVGATKEDLQKLGIDNMGGVKLKDLAGKSFEEIVKAHKE